jgi:hypothetical protein
MQLNFQYQCGCGGAGKVTSTGGWHYLMRASAIYFQKFKFKSTGVCICIG